MSRLAFITGGSRGLGRSGALALAAQGVDVIITYMGNYEAAQDVLEQVRSAGRKAYALQLDITDFERYPAFIEALIQTMQTEFGKTQLDYLLNNAGFGMNKPFAEITADELDTMYQVHLKAPFVLTQALLPYISDNGHILNVSSGLTRFSFPGYSAYAAMKGGVEVLTHYLAKELGERGISVNTLAPGAIATDFNGGAVRDKPELNQLIASVTAKGRPGEAEDIGNAIAMLLSENSRWITGQRIEASGGMFL